MDLNPNPISGQFLKNYDLMLSEYRKTWIGLLEKNLKDYLKDFRKFLKEIQKSENFWSHAESFINKQIVWGERAEKALQDYRQEDFWEISNRHYDSLYKSCAEKIDLEVTPQDWEPETSDTTLISIWKFSARNRHRFFSRYYQTVNRIRMWLKKSALEIPGIPLRTVFVHLLIARYIQWSLNRKILREWTIFQREAGKTLFDLHEHGERFLKEIISGSRELAFSEEGDNSGAQEIYNRLKQIFQEVQESVDLFIGQTSLDSESDLDLIEALKERFSLKWQYCGTSALHDSEYSRMSVKKESENVNGDLHKFNKNWKLLFTGEFGDWKRDLQMTLLQLKASSIGANLLKDTRQSMEADILPEFSKNRALVEKCIENVKSLKNLTRTRVRTALKKENRLLIKGLGHEKLLLLTDNIMQSKLLISLQNYQILLTEEAAHLPAKQKLMVRRELETLNPNPKIDEIPSKELVEIYGLQPLNVTHSQLMLDGEKIHRRTLRTISMMDQIIDFQFETAINLIQQNRSDESVKEAEQVLIDGLERLAGQFDDLINENQAFLFNSRKTIEEMTKDFIDSIQMLEDSERVFELNLKLTRAKTKTKYQAMQHTVLVKLKMSALRLFKLIRNILKRIFRSYKRLRKITGIEESKIRVEDEILRLLTVSYSPLEKLPLVYQRLFKIEALQEDRFFYQRHSEYDALEAEFHNWQNDPVSPVVLVGEKGSGKSTLINYARNRIYFDYPVFECTPKITIDTKDDLLKLLRSALGLTGIENLEQLENKILEESEPCVCIFENIQRLFLRKVGGFKALQRLLLFISRTSGKIHWLMSCSLYSWEFLDKAIDCSKYFHKIIHMEELSVDEIKGIIEQRHRTSGFELLFQPSASFAKSSRYRKLPSEKARQSLLSDMFFNDLHDIAQGNITVAMLFWVTAIKEIRKDELVLSTVLSWDQSPFQKMPPDELFTLAAIIQHDGLTITQHSRVFYQDFVKSQSIITRLKNNGLLIETDLGYSIHPILYRPIVQVLRNKNILH